jgi:hypothetical protein
MGPPPIDLAYAPLIRPLGPAGRASGADDGGVERRRLGGADHGKALSEGLLNILSNLCCFL